MKPTLSKKIKTYSAVAGSVIAVSTSADAQVVYTDISPDSTFIADGNLYNLDLDNDGTFDFTFTLTISVASTTTARLVGVTPAGTNGIAGSVVGAYVYPFAMNAGDTVKASLTFNTTPSQSMASSFGAGISYGNWLGAVDKYIGLNFYIASQPHYGWARLDVDSSANRFTIKDYAYNAVPNDYIIAGETGVGIIEHTMDTNVLMYCFEKMVTVKFLNEQTIDAKEIEITNVLGQEIYRAPVLKNETMIDLQNQQPGIYFVNILQKEGVITQKINVR
jgi:Secretion system C-terminal sorting domain